MLYGIAFLLTYYQCLQVGALQKDVNLAVSKYGKLLDRAFCTDIAKAYREAEFNGHLINEIVAVHFYRQGLFDLGDCFVHETQEANAMALKTPFFEMYQNLEQLRARNLEPVLNWARQNRPALQKKVSHLPHSLSLFHNPCVFLLHMKRHISGLIGLLFCHRMGITYNPMFPISNDRGVPRLWNWRILGFRMPSHIYSK